jgi:thioredoxin reductase (NADPH)
MRASKIMQERVKKTENIQIHWNTEIDEILGNEKGVTSVRIVNRKDQTKSEVLATGVFIAIGHKPNTDLFKEWITLDEAGYIVTEAKSSRTNIEGVFACGDAQDNVYRQAVTAAGTGCMAALDAERYLAEKGLI